MNRVDWVGDAAATGLVDRSAEARAAQIGCDVRIEDRGSELVVHATLPEDARDDVCVAIAGNVMSIRSRASVGCGTERRPLAGSSVRHAFCLPVAVSEQNARVSVEDGVVRVIVATGQRSAIGRGR